MSQLYKLRGFNAVSNAATNPYQSDKIKALCVCSAGLLRSPTIASFLTQKGYNTRACGTSLEYALVQLSSALLHWADEIHVVKEQEQVIRDALKELKLESTDVYVYDIPDKYPAFDPELLELIEKTFEETV